jgi:4-amino-4-deoxy-L-arabinose transferase-like glycosyltransferase
MRAMVSPVPLPPGEGTISRMLRPAVGQSWAWAYSAHNPPGPTWIVRALQTLGGPGLLSVTLPKFGWWLLSFLALYACARRLFASRTQAVHTTLWLAGVYYVSWECVLNYSHSVQVLAISLLLLWQVLRMRRSRGLIDYLLLGGLVALGLLSKFNFAVLLLAMGGASLWVPAYRQLLCDRRLVATLLVALVCLTPVVFAQWQLLVASPAATSAKFGIAPDWSLRVALHGAGSALMALASWLSPLLVFVLALAPRVALPLPVQPPRTTPDAPTLRALVAVRSISRATAPVLA